MCTQEESNYIRQILKDEKGDINSNTIIVGILTTLCTSMDRSSRRKIKMETLDLKDRLYRTSLTDIRTEFNQKAAGYTFFSSEHRTFSRIDHMLDHKAGLRKFKKTEIVSSISSIHKLYGQKPTKRKQLQKTQIHGLINVLLNDQWITEEIKEEILNIPRDKWKNNNPKPMGSSKSSHIREVYSNTSLSQETGKISIKKHNFIPKATR